MLNGYSPYLGNVQLDETFNIPLMVPMGLADRLLNTILMVPMGSGGHGMDIHLV